MPVILPYESSRLFLAWQTLCALEPQQFLLLFLWVSLLVVVSLLIRKDYQKFLALGPGGTPSTFAGYLRVSYLRLYALSDPFQPPSLAFACLPNTGYLHELTRRSAVRPHTQGIAPHRQTDQHCNAQLHQSIRNALHLLADNHPASLKKGNSCFEKNGLALFLSPNDVCSGEISEKIAGHLNPTCADTGEICHLHPSDSSMHLTLHPVDAALVIASGWGERHPLAGRFIHGSRLLPAGFVMVYSPQTEREIEAVVKIVKAAAWWVGGVDLFSNVQ